MRRLGMVLAIAALALLQMGAGPSKKKKEGLPPKVQETVGDIASVFSSSQQKVKGVGLVVGLDNTGVDPPSTWQRKQLVDEIRHASSMNGAWDTPGNASSNNSYKPGENGANGTTLET